jgi:hypothetical protein
MLHFVRGDGGMIVVPKEELVRWADETYVKIGNSFINCDEINAYRLCLEHLKAELEAIGK